MRSLISEFSYGFALTHELVKSMGALSAAPIFPSLVAEGKIGGGYDVKLEKPGLPLFIQFKRSECIVRESGREIKNGARLGVPYYRFAITASSDSDQHEALLGWDVAPNEVFYAAPMFHKSIEFDDAFLKGEVRHRSFFVRPRDIGYFFDGKTHYVSFDGKRGYVMSEPVEIKVLGISDLEAHFREKLANENRSLREVLPEIVDRARRARDEIRRGEAKKRTIDAESQSQRSTAAGEAPSEVVPKKSSSVEEFVNVQRSAVASTPIQKFDVDDSGGKLIELADIGIRDFSAQLYIIQERD